MAKLTTRQSDTIRCAVIGYGMGKLHADYITKTEGLELVVVCDIDPKRTEAARQDFPQVKTFNSIDDLLDDGKFDLATIALPHNAHASVAVQYLKEEKHVIVEKPMCITVAEATEMIETAKKSKVMVTTFHNRRFDGDFIAIREVIQKGLIGDVFQVETGGGGYGHPGTSWRADKTISGGAFYDWGAHFLDWILGIVPGKMVSVTGFFHKLVWHDATNEDHVHAIIRFESGAVADAQLSHITKVGRAKWRILGTKGAILDPIPGGSGAFKVYLNVESYPAEIEVKYKQSEWQKYYENIAGHLLRDEELVVKPEESRRVIAIMETAEKSAKSGKAEPVPYE
jgi:predicted dehydrogenase